MAVFLCLSGRITLFIHGGFETEDAAKQWADNANRWYGRGHPLYPIRVEPLKMAPPLFPADAWEAMSEAEDGSPEQDAAMRAMFATLLDDNSKAPPGLKGGRKR